MSKLKQNDGPIAGMRLSHKVFDLSLDLFVTLYLWNETGQNLGLLCLYRGVFSIAVFAAMMAFVYISRSHKRKWIMAGGRCMLLVYIVMLISFGPASADHIPILAIIHGIGTGMHYVIYNQYEAEGLSGNLSERSRFIGLYEAASAVIKAAYPFLTGILMDKFGILPVGIFCIISSLLVILFAILYDDKGCTGKVSFRNYFSYLQKNSDIAYDAKYFAACDFFRAFTCSYASFSLFTNVCLMSLSENAVTFGAANSALFILSVCFGLVFKQIATEKQSVLWVGQVAMLILLSIFGMGIFSTPYSGMFFGVFMLLWNFYLVSDSMVYGTATGLFAKCEVTDYITECFVVNEFVLTIGRVIGYTGLWLLWEKAGNLILTAGGNNIVVSLIFGFYILFIWLSFAVNKKLWTAQML